jgi:hypothetical protein
MLVTPLKSGGMLRQNFGLIRNRRRLSYGNNVVINPH